MTIGQAKPPPRPRSAPTDLSLAAEDLAVVPTTGIHRWQQSMEESWHRQGAEVGGALRPGVSSARLASLHLRLGPSLPAAAQQWWSRWDGVDPVEVATDSGQLTLPTVGPGGWVPLTLDRAEHLFTVREPLDWGHRFPMFVRDDEFLAVRLNTVEAVVEQVITEDPSEPGFEVGLETLLQVWADALAGGTVYWLSTTRAWHCNPFSLREMEQAHLVW